MKKIRLIKEIKELGSSALDDEGIVLALAERENYYGIVKYVSERLKNDKDFMLEIFRLSEDYLLVQYSGDTLKNDKDFMLRAINLSPIMDVVKHASQPLKSDKNFIIKAIGFDYKSYFYVSEELKNDKEIAMAAINQNPDMANCIKGNLENDSDIIAAKIKASPSIKEKSIAKRNKFLLPIQACILFFGLMFILFGCSFTIYIILAFCVTCSMILCMCYPEDEYGTSSSFLSFFALLLGAVAFPDKIKIILLSAILLYLFSLVLYIIFDIIFNEQLL